MGIQELKNLALHLGIEFHHALGEEKLKAKIEDYCLAAGTTLEAELEAMPSDSNLTDEEKFIRSLKGKSFSKAPNSAAKKDTQKRLKESMINVRCIINPNNPSLIKKNGDIFSVGNAVGTDFKKFIPYGVKTHIPKILLDSIKERKYQTFKIDKKGPNGIEIKRSVIMDEFNITILPPLSTQEFNAIKQRQEADPSMQKSE